MPILPLPQFEADLKSHLDEEDRKAYEALKAPKTLVVRFGSMKLVGEFPYQGDIKPGCGSKMVVRTFRGTELGEMLTSTCPNSGCSKSVSRQEMLRYIENSGGRDYPFFTEGRVLRVATREDMDHQAALEQSRHELRLKARDVAQRVGMHAKVVDVEPILGGESVTVFYLSEERVELRDFIRELSRELHTHIEMRHVGARDEARLTADYEKCGQYCCCKNFLKVLKPISMKSAKVQKATLDPLKISGRCGRLMCCLRYEDETYEGLRKRLPRKKSRVGTPEGDGLVIDAQILTQLVLVELDELGTDGRPRQVAIPVENLAEPVSKTAPVRPPPGMEPPRGEGPRGPRPPRPQGPPAPPRAPGADAPPRPRESPRPAGAPADQTRSPRPPSPRPAPPPRQGPPPPAPPPAPKSRDAEIDELLSEMEDDVGHSSSGPGETDGSAPGGGRRRRRRRRGRGPGGPPGPAGEQPRP